MAEIYSIRPAIFRRRRQEADEYRRNTEESLEAWEERAVDLFRRSGHQRLFARASLEYTALLIEAGRNALLAVYDGQEVTAEQARASANLLDLALRQVRTREEQRKQRNAARRKRAKRKHLVPMK